MICALIDALLMTRRGRLRRAGKPVVADRRPNVPACLRACHSVLLKAGYGNNGVSQNVGPSNQMVSIIVRDALGF